DALERDALFHLDWTRPHGAAETDAPGTVGLLGTDPHRLGAALTAAGCTVTPLTGTGGADTPELVLVPVAGSDSEAVPAEVHALTARVLGHIRHWLAEDTRDGSRLVFVTRGAVAAADGPLTDPAAAAVWGLVRSAQA
ncbi:hypothetical protein G3M53_63755, partial [Streptomyces sp. SID7982]|nr:hypothetical protein [Streptomyces sp. SID7982]